MKKILAFICGIGLLQAAFAQTGGSADPLRPPAAILNPVESAAPLPATRLTSVIVPKRGAKGIAVIDGLVVKVGDKVGDSLLVKVTESSAVLSGPGGRETLYLMPDVTKTPVARNDAGRIRKKETP